MTTKPSWEEIAAKKRADLVATFPKELVVPANLLPPDSQDNVLDWPATSGWFTPEELAITGSTATELVAKLATGELKSETVTKAFIKRAVAAHQLLNCLSETCFDRALKTARALDEHMAKTGKPVGPLHGLPISLKDNFNLAGLDSTVGFASYVGDPAASDSALASVLEAAGAVFYVKTNVPTAMMIAETVNNVFGRTTNPRNRRTTSGGSSGGESALILFCGSPLGVGSDIGGSLRIPAACTGIFTIRSSGGRFPLRNCRSGMPGQEAVMSVNGPLARTIEDIAMYTKAVLDSEPWLVDAKCLPIPWRGAEVANSLKTRTAPLKIAVLWDDGIVRPTPPVTRALKETAAKLKAAGHTVVDWDPVDQKEGTNILDRLFVADGGQTILHEVARTGEPLRPEMQMYGEAKDLPTSAMWKLHLERSAYQNKYLDRWKAADIDAILLPTTPYSAPKSGEFRYVGYTGVYNVLDYACVSFPSGLTVDKAVDVVDPSLAPHSDICKQTSDEYDPELSHGLTINLQLAARRLEEEKVVAMTQTILDILAK